MSFTNLPKNLEIASDTGKVALQEFQLDLRMFALGIVWLTLGFAFYVIARPPTALAILSQFPQFRASVPAELVRVLGPVPTFIHVVAFSLLTASLGRRDRRRRLLACGGWAVIEITFEFSQHPAFGCALLQHGALVSSIPYLRSYLIGGTFDYADVVAAVIGAAFAGSALMATRGVHNV